MEQVMRLTDTDDVGEGWPHDHGSTLPPRLDAPLSSRPLNHRPGIAIAGEIDSSNADRFAEMLDALRSEDSYVDLSGVELMDGSGVRVLLDEAWRLQARGHVLTLISPGYIVRRALSILTPEELLSTIRIVDR